MKIFDAHCDVLYKMWKNPKLSFLHDSNLHVTYEQLALSGSKVQCFAIYIPEYVRYSERFNVALEMIDIFYNKVLSKSRKLKLVKTKNDINQLKSDEIGAMLTLEGCDVIDRDIVKLRTLFRLGVSSVGLTWNYSNAVADGVLEKRGAGLSDFGIEVIRENNLYKVWTDVSHLSEKGFWDCVDHAEFMIASHSNSYSICPHPRNLKDEQIKAIIQKNGMIGITFVPQFLTMDGNAAISEIIKHIDYICSMGGEDHIGFGSDFDGIDNTVKGLEFYSKYEKLISELFKYYSSNLVEKFLFQNFYNHLPN